MGIEAWVIIGIFLGTFILIATEAFNKAIIAIVGALAMVIMGALDFHEAIAAINFEAIFLLMGMMMLVHILQESRILLWVNVKLARLTQGNPLLIFVLFSLLTAVLSSFLDNVTTVLIVLPLIISLTRGIGKDPKPYIFGIIMFANIGGALTIVGDPSSTIIGIDAGFTFNDFIKNLWFPILCIFAVVLSAAVLRYWRHVKPSGKDLRQLFVSQLMLRKVQQQFLHIAFKKHFVISAIVVMLATLAGFILQPYTGILVPVTALAGASVLALLVSRDIDVHRCFNAVEWTTLFFFGGLFVMVAGVESTGILEKAGETLVSLTDNFFLLLMVILWGSAFLSMIIDNIPFVVVMLPLIHELREAFASSPHLDFLWWALLFGAVLGGSGTLIGASVNVVSIGLAERAGIKITFAEYFKHAFPLTFVALSVASLYFAFVLYA